MPESFLSLPGEFGEVDLDKGTQILRIEDVFQDLGDCERGDQVGVVYLEETETRRADRILVTATFEFANGDTFVARGPAGRVIHEERPSFEGRLAVGMGTGKYLAFRGQATVEHCNPKRWSVEP